MKLSKFTQFANSLYPHELDYLIDIQRFENSENVKILNHIRYNTLNPKNLLPYDSQIDKRRYNYLTNWINNQLNEIDVDAFFDWLMRYEEKVMTDIILPDEEKEILQKAQIISQTHYYFIKFYELLKHYRDYLLIRNRMEYYQPVAHYLKENEFSYKKSIEINEELNKATVDIVSQHSNSQIESLQWENFLKSIFCDSQLDGYTRYRSAVRLTYMYYNYREFENLRTIYDSLDKFFKTSIFYSKRILTNYYANRAMMHSKLLELNEAEKYGYLSIRHVNSDYIFYLLNLCGVLLKSKKSKEALNLMQTASGQLKKTSNYYYRIGFSAFYVKTLVVNAMYKNAEEYAETFWQAYKSEILSTRWHLFFSSFFQALAFTEKYNRIISLSKSYKLINKEKQQIGNAKYLPILFWYNTLAEYMTGKISGAKLEQIIIKSANLLVQHNYKMKKVKELLDELMQFAPVHFKNIKSNIEFLKICL